MNPATNPAIDTLHALRDNWAAGGDMGRPDGFVAVREGVDGDEAFAEAYGGEAYAVKIELWTDDCLMDLKKQDEAAARRRGEALAKKWAKEHWPHTGYVDLGGAEGVYGATWAWDKATENELERTDPDEVVRLPAARSNPAARKPPASHPLDKDLYEAVKEEAKERFDVWPSAYASGWVVKTYKARGGRYAVGDKKTRSGLTKWFGESWVDLSRPIHDEDGELVGYEPCGRKASDDPAAYPKCRPLKEAMRMSPSEVKDAIKRKRAAEAKAGRGGRGGRGARAPVRVSTYRANPDVTSTPAFRRWFGDSKVVDAAGEPRVVYHGAPDVRGIFAGGFKRSSMRGDVFFATDDPRTAETYTDPHRAWDYQNAEPGVIPLYLRIENPLVVDAGFQHWRGTAHVIKQARQAGHDGVIIENTIDHYASDRKAKPRREDACTVFAFFSPTQVKSALTGPMKARDPNRWHVSTSQPLDFTGPNDGTFDLDDADLRSNPDVRRPRPRAREEDMLDAIQHADVYGDQGWTLDDFTILPMGEVPLSRVLGYEDCAWLDVDPEDFAGMSAEDRLTELSSFRGPKWAARAAEWLSEGVPPIVVIDAPVADEDVADEAHLYRQIGDGRGRVNFALAMGLKTLPVVIMKWKHPL